MTMEEKWKKVREFYESNYRLRSPLKKSSDEAIEGLFKNMMQVQKHLGDFYYDHPDLFEAYEKSKGFKVF